MTRDQQWVVYVLLSEKLNMIKIGRTKNPRKRLKALRIGNPDNLRFLALFVEDAQISEKLLHKRFLHIRRVREWFVADKEILEFLDQHREQSVARRYEVPKIKTKERRDLLRLCLLAAAA